MSQSQWRGCTLPWAPGHEQKSSREKQGLPSGLQHFLASKAPHHVQEDMGHSPVSCLT